MALFITWLVVITSKPVVPEVGDERIRERFIYSYRLVYRVEPEQILIVAVIHGKRLLENVPERFDSNA
jgi:toxin ParE1/3/4